MSLRDHNDPDIYGDLLREYLLEHDGENPDGESLMEVAFDHTEPSLAPPPSKEAEILNRLKKDFAQTAPPSPAGMSRRTKVAIFSTFAVAASIALFFLIFYPRTEIPSRENPANPALNLSENLSGTENTGENDIQPAISNESPDNVDTELIGNNRQTDGRKQPAIRKPGKQTLLSPANTPVASNLSKPGTQDVEEEKDNLSSNSPDRIVSPFPLRELFAQTTVISQFHQVDNDRGDVILAKNGTLMHFPAQCFVNASGTPVTGRVQVEIKEVYDMADFVLSNLPTVSNGRQLISAGAVYLSASALGQQLDIAPGKDVYVEFASAGEAATRDMQIFQGTYNFRGELNLVPQKESGSSGKMIALPLDQLNFESYTCNCGKYFNNGLYELTDPMYQETWVATREFTERINEIAKLESVTNFYQAELLKVYRDNIDKPLWKADQAVAETLREIARREGGESLEFKDEVFQSFAAQMLSDVEVFNDHGVNFEDQDARRQLMEKGVAATEADRLIRVYDLTKQYLGDPSGGIYMGRQKKKKLPAGMVAFDRANVKNDHRDARKGFSITRTGWASLGRFLQSEDNQSNASLNVAIRGEKPDQPTSTYLVMSGMKSMIPGRLTGMDEARFRDLPENKTAYVVTIGYDQFTPYLGIRKINLEGEQDTYVVLQQTSIDQMISALRELN